MPRLRGLLWGGLALAGLAQLLLLALVLRQGPAGAPGLQAGHVLKSSAARGGSGAPGDDVPDIAGSVLLEFNGRGLSLALRLGAGNRSLWWQSVSADLEGAGEGDGSAVTCRTRRLGPTLFDVRLEGGGGFSSSACSMHDLRVEPPASAAAAFRCPGGVSVRWELRLQQDQHFARVSVALAQDAGTPSAALGKLTILEVPAAEGCDRVHSTGTVPGSPVLIGKRWFLGVEHPLGVHRPIDGELESSGGIGSRGVRAGVGHLAARSWPPRHGTSWRYSVALGACGEASQARRAFLAYLDAARPPERWSRQMLHYNSWFDMHSWQDDEFFQEHSVYRLLKREEMTEALALDRVQSFSEALGRNHSLQLDSYLWDDGWDDPKTLWDFDRARFPDGFSRVAALARDGGSGTGVWLSPWGGYGSKQKERIELGIEQGYETNEGGFSLAGPRYFARFRDAVLSMRRNYNVNLFKFDGVAGDPSQVGEEMEAMLALIAEIRSAARTPGNRTSTPGGASKRREGTAEGEEREDGKRSSGDEEDPWINLTTGTWPSPFFLLWADSIWRGGGDVGTLRHYMLAGLTLRQRWIVWRELLVCKNVVKRAGFFPLSQLMIHGVVVGLHGEALLRGLHQHNTLDFAQEAWSFVGMGLRLQELYLSPQLLALEDWANLAEALRWSRENLDVLRDSHWVLGEFEDFTPYGVASWRPASTGRSARGFLMLRNPLGRAQSTGSFSLDDILELPLREAGLTLEVDLVKSLSGGPERSGCALGDPHSSNATDRGACVVKASRQVRVAMRPTEVLVLGFRPLDRR